MNDKIKRVALYCRVSTEDQAREGTSLEVQRERLEVHAKQNNWEIYYPEPNEVYVDDGYSGYVLERPALKKMLKDAKLKKFDAILFLKIDRFARNARHLLNVAKELKDIDIDIISATEPFDTSTASGEMTLGLMGVIGQFGRDTIIERVFPGMIKGVQKGNWQGARYSPYGYKYNKEKKLLEVIPEEADIVKLIYTLYLSNLSSQQVAGYLYKKGYKTRSGGRFHSKLVGDILKSKFYLGKIVWNKHCYDKKQKTAKGYFKYVKNDPSKVIEADGRHEAIISQDDFDLVQKKLARNRRGSLHRSRPNFYPLSGVVICSDCDHKFRGKLNTANHHTGKKKRWYACNAKHEHNIDCSNPAIKAEELEPQIFAVLNALMQHPDIKEGRITGLTTQTSQQNDAELDKAKADLEAKLKENFRMQKSNNKAHLENLLSDEVFTDTMIDLRNEEQGLKKQLAKINVQLLEKERSEAYQKTLARVLENFDKTKDVLDPITQKELIQLVIKRVLLKDKKIVKLELYQPFQRYLEELKCNITQIITTGTANSSLLRPMVVK